MIVVEWCYVGIEGSIVSSNNKNFNIVEFMHKFLTIPTANMMYTTLQTTQIWWLANLEYKHLKYWLLLLLFDVFVPTNAHPLLFFNKSFVQI